MIAQAPLDLNLRRFGFTVLRHPQVEGGPRVWTVLLRVGAKKQLDYDDLWHDYMESRRTTT